MHLSFSIPTLDAAFLPLAQPTMPPLKPPPAAASPIEHDWQDRTLHLENGIAQEACHDFLHTGYGFTSISYMAETAPIQGMDPYGTDVGWRYRLGIHSKYDLAAFPERGLEAGSWPERICHTIQL